MTTALDLEIKSHKDATRINLYKKQIAQLAACIADREARIARRAPVIERLDIQERAHFAHAVNRAGLTYRDTQPALGDQFETDHGIFELCSFSDDLIGFYCRSRDWRAVSGKDLETIAKVFFMDYPLARKI